MCFIRRKHLNIPSQRRNFALAPQDIGLYAHYKTSRSRVGTAALPLLAGSKADPIDEDGSGVAIQGYDPDLEASVKAAKEPSISNGSSGSVSISVVGAFAHVKHASGRTSADIFRSVSTSDAWACTARAERFQRPTGFPTSSPLPTIQSKAFFSVPGTPWAYSGLDITTRRQRSLVRESSSQPLDRNPNPGPD